MSENETARPNDPHEGHADGGLGGIVRRVLSRDPSAEERLDQILSERRRELAEQASIVEQTLEDLERREARLRDSRASIERLLRLGQRDLDLRETDLVRLGRELDERQARIEHEQEELTRRKVELGAVELKRAALEQRERALATRETELEAREAAAAGSGRSDPDSAADVDTETSWLLFVPGARYRLVEIVRAPLRPGDRVDLEDVEYVVSKTGPSPLAGDGRRCAYLVRGGPVRPEPGGSR